MGARQKATADIVDQIEPDAVLLTGNGQYYDGTYENYLAAYESTWGRFKGITHPTVGVHDYDNDGYFRYFGAAAGDPDKAYYSFDLGAWHIVALNSICSKVGVGVGSEQERWLRQDLEANKGKPILAYWFNTRFSSGPYGSDSSLKPFWQALFDYHAQLVINGSDHLYERFAPQDPEGKADPQGIRQFTSGLGGSTFYQLERNCPNSEKSYNQSFGVLKLTLSSDSYEWEFLPEPGNDFTDKGRQVIR
ncbi:MAG TPA: alkaline phosphatase [Cyanobacteria bacterium UBA8530]|nr:alkaline phosphatase [Cyanobacteria bacterium UBA8530]